MSLMLICTGLAASCSGLSIHFFFFAVMGKMSFPMAGEAWLQGKATGLSF